jgi:hypothetical protein
VTASSSRRTQTSNSQPRSMRIFRRVTARVARPATHSVRAPPLIVLSARQRPRAPVAWPRPHPGARAGSPSRPCSRHRPHWKPRCGFAAPLGGTRLPSAARLGTRCDPSRTAAAAQGRPRPAFQSWRKERWGVTCPRVAMTLSGGLGRHTIGAMTSGQDRTSVAALHEPQRLETTARQSGSEKQ